MGSCIEISLTIFFGLNFSPTLLNGFHLSATRLCEDKVPLSHRKKDFKKNKDTGLTTSSRQ